MNTEELNLALYQKMKRELELFQESFLALPHDEMLRRAYNLVVRQDFLDFLEYYELDETAARALLNSKHPLDDIFNEFDELDLGHFQVFQKCAAVCAKNAERLYLQNREKTRNVPLYPYSYEYANANGQSADYYNSREANLLCKDAIEAALQNYFDGTKVHPDAVRQVADCFSSERILYVLANTVQLSEWDSLYSAENKAWARTVQVAFDEGLMTGNRNTDMIIEANTVNLNDFITMAREEFAHNRPLASGEITADSQSAGKEHRKPKSPAKRKSPER